MDTHRFEVIARVLSRAGSRRRFVRDVAAIAAGGALVTVHGVRADSGSDTAVGGGTDLDCPTPSTGTSTAGSTATAVGGPAGVTPTSVPANITAVPPFPAFVIGGTCDALEPSTTFNLIDVGAEATSAAGGSAISVVQSTTSLRLQLQDLVTTDHAIVIQTGSGDDTAIVCGNLGDIADGDVLSVGLGERNSSGYAGIANLTANGSETLIDLFIAGGLFNEGSSDVASADTTTETPDEETPTPDSTPGVGGDATEIPTEATGEPTEAPSDPGFAEGDVVVALSDVNLRAEPSETADVIAIVGEGAELTVLGPAEGDWLPVQDAGGNTGYVNLAFVGS